MATVHFTPGIRQYTAGQAQLVVQPGQIRAVLRQVLERFPDLDAVIGSGMAISIDGVITQDPLLELVGPDSEVHFVPPMGGG